MSSTSLTTGVTSLAVPGGLPHAATRAQVLVALGVMSLCPRISGVDIVLAARAGHTFNALLMLATQAGFPKKEKRLFIGGLRGGKPIPSVMARAEWCISLIGPAAFDAEVARRAAWEYFEETGKLAPGWTWREPPAASGTGATRAAP